MRANLRNYIIELKSMNQHIDDMVLSTGDSNGRGIDILVTQEVIKQLTDNTNFYLSWTHQETGLTGQVPFDRIADDRFFLRIPDYMLKEGNIAATIQLIDEISIVETPAFNIHVLYTPNTGENFIESDTYEDFKTALIEMNKVNVKVEEFSEVLQQFAESMQLQQAQAADLIVQLEEIINNLSDIEKEE